MYSLGIKLWLIHIQSEGACSPLSKEVQYEISEEDNFLKRTVKAVSLQMGST